MTPDTHPLIIHFPIALLSFYVGVEVLCLFVKKWQDSLFITKLFLLFTGTLTALIGLQTGEIAEHIRGGSALIELHSGFAESAYTLFAILSSIYLIRIIIQSKRIKQYPLYQEKLLSLVMNRWFGVIVAFAAIIGFLLLVVTGALGAVLVHGPEIDPVVGWIYSLFFP